MKDFFEAVTEMFGLNRADRRSEAEKRFDNNILAFITIGVLLTQALIWFACVYQIYSWVKSVL